jgi:phage baseplate assembly protein W
MADIQVMYLQDVLPVTNVQPLDTNTPSLKISGSRFDSASTVLLNGIVSNVFVILHAGEIVVEIPELLQEDLIRSVAVLSSRALTGGRSVASFVLERSPSKVSGIQRLVQRFALMMLTTPGSDIVNPELGGGLQTLLGKTLNGKNQGTGIQSVVQQSISKTENDIKSLQANSIGLGFSEQLLSASLDRVTFDSRTATLAIRIIVQSAAGQVATANLFV